MPLYLYITDIELTAANIDDREVFWELLPNNFQSIVLADKGITQVLSNSLEGLKAIIQNKVLGHNRAYFMNKRLGMKATGQIKHLIFG